MAGHRRKKRKAKGIRRRSKKTPQPVKPQIWLTLLWHMGMHMPWSWRSGPSNSSEREHFRAMLTEQTFPENRLFCADAGFTGYDLWKAIVDGGHSFSIRVGGNGNLLRKYGSVRTGDGIVYFWPAKIARCGPPPLVLRLLNLPVGRRKMWLVTNGWDAKELSEAEAVELYRLRGGLLGLWRIQLFAIKEQIELGAVPESRGRFCKAEGRGTKGLLRTEAAEASPLPTG